MKIKKIISPIIKAAIWIALLASLVRVVVLQETMDVDRFYSLYWGLLIALIVYTILLLILFFVGRERNRKSKRQALIDTLNSFIGKHIDEVLSVMPPPTKTVKHRILNYIRYSWKKKGFSISIMDLIIDFILDILLFRWIWS